MLLSAVFTHPSHKIPEYFFFLVVPGIEHRVLVC